MGDGGLCGGFGGGLGDGGLGGGLEAVGLVVGWRRWARRRFGRRARRGWAPLRSRLENLQLFHQPLYPQPPPELVAQRSPPRAPRSSRDHSPAAALAPAARHPSQL